jgi:hypothetical protein
MPRAGSDELLAPLGRRASAIDAMPPIVTSNTPVQPRATIDQRTAYTLQQTAVSTRTSRILTTLNA